MQHDAGIPVTVGYASSAAIANQRRFRKLPHRAHPFIPGIATPHIKVPIHIKTLVAPITNKALWLPTQMLLHIGDRSARIVDGKQAAQIIDGVEGFDQLGGFEIDKTRVRRPSEGGRAKTSLL